MTVRKPDRTPTNGLLLVQDAAYRLYAHTAHCCSNEKTIPKRYRWCTGQFLVAAASKICEHIDIANTMRLDDSQERVWRLKYQKLALGATYNLLTELHKAWYTHHFDEAKLLNWLELVMEVQRLLRAWTKSEAGQADGSGGTASKASPNASNGNNVYNVNTSGSNNNNNANNNRGVAPDYAGRIRRAVK